MDGGELMQLKPRPQAVISDIATLAGFVLVTAGLHQVYSPLAWMFCGVALLAGGIARSPTDGTNS
jgi:hypothetical protein